MKRTLLIGALGLIALYRALASGSPPAAGSDPAEQPVRALPHFIVRHPWLSMATLLLCLTIGAGVTVAVGILPITASSRHWAITEWVLHFAMRRSIATHSAFVEPPPLDDFALVLRGAGHYELGCRPCHGAPGTRLPTIPAGMTPHPPELSPRIPAWESEDLFYIVKHGVKFTGMPAWPVHQRDDEVWAMVAFLRRLPQLGELEYQALARGDVTTIAELAPRVEPRAAATPPRAVVEICARCHGVDGTGRGVGAFPKLAGQRTEYLENSLRAYADGGRHSGVMRPIAAALTPQTISEVSRYYGELSAPVSALGGLPTVGMDASSAIARGETIALRGVPSQDIPSCADCHGPTPAPRNPAYPILSGQYVDYLTQQLHLLTARHRGGSPYVRLMHAFVDRLTNDQIRDVTSYYAAEPSASTER